MCTESPRVLLYVIDNSSILSANEMPCNNCSQPLIAVKYVRPIDKNASTQLENYTAATTRRTPIFFSDQVPFNVCRGFFPYMSAAFTFEPVSNRPNIITTSRFLLELSSRLMTT